MSATQPPITSEYCTDDDPESCHQNAGWGCTPVDIGNIFSQTKSSGEVCKALQTLTAAQKYEVFKNRKEPHKDHVSHKIPWWLQSFFLACVAVSAWFTASRWMVCSALLVIFLCSPFNVKVCNLAFPCVEQEKSEDV